MSEAKGIHEHDTKKLGRRPPKRKAAVDAGQFLAVGQLPDHPLVDAVPALSYPMDRNDVAGDCVVAGLDHALQTINAALGVSRQNWSDAQLLAYYQSQNPGFRSWADAGGDNDQGMDIQTFLEHLVQTGDIAAFGKLDVTNLELLRAATWVGIAVVTGEDLRKAQGDQTVWDYKPNSAEWGGHCTTTVAYQPGQQGIVTWGEVVEATDAFFTHQVEEAWFVLTTAHIQHPYFRDNFDVQGFANAVQEITGGKVIVPVPPPAPVPPPPAPGPTPPPVPPPPAPVPDVLADFPFGALDAWSGKPTSQKLAPVASRAYLNWKHAHNL